MVKDSWNPPLLVCLLCGAHGDLCDIQGYKCKPTPSPPKPPRSSAVALGNGVLLAHEKAEQEFTELRRQESELAQLLLLQKLETEQAILESLLEQQKVERAQTHAAAPAPNSEPRPAAPPADTTMGPDPSNGPVSEAPEASHQPMEVDPPMPPPPAPVLNLPYGALDLIATCCSCSIQLIKMQCNLGYDNMETIPMDVELMSYESPPRLDATPAKSDETPVAGTSEALKDSATHDIAASVECCMVLA